MLMNGTGRPRRKRLSWESRCEIVAKVVELGMTPEQSADCSGVHRSTVYRLLARFAAGGWEALRERPSTPRRQPRRLAAAVEEALAAPALRVSDHERWLVAGAGHDWPTAQEAVLKLREGAHVAAEAHQTEQLLHGHLAAIDEGVRAFVLEGEGEGRAAERAGQAVAALRELGADATLVPTVHPVVDIVRFQQLTVDLADARGVDPDRIRRDEERWARARAAHE